MTLGSNLKYERKILEWDAKQQKNIKSEMISILVGNSTFILFFFFYLEVWSTLFKEEAQLNYR